jgi:5-oxoprolinase (ATP-hydrolysing)
MTHIQKNAENAVRNYLKSVFGKLPPGRTLKAVDRSDNGNRIHVEIRIREDGSPDFDFTGTGSECFGNGNAPKSVCLSAIIYCLRCLINYDVPLNQGCLANINVVNPC